MARVARVITARIMVPMAPAVKAWMAPDGVTAGVRPDRPLNARPTGIHR